MLIQVITKVNTTRITDDITSQVSDSNGIDIVTTNGNAINNIIAKLSTIVRKLFVNLITTMLIKKC